MPIDLLAVIAKQQPTPPGVTVYRCKVWASLAITLALTLVGAWAYDYAFSGQLRVISGKAVLGMVAWPFMVIWWGWNTVRGIRLRFKGQFEWAVSDTHFAYVPVGGGGMGQLPLSAISGVTLTHVPRLGKVVEISIAGTMNGQSVTLKMPLDDLGEDKIGLMALRPSSGKTLFKALGKRLETANPSARVADYSGT